MGCSLPSGIQSLQGVDEVGLVLRLQVAADQRQGSSFLLLHLRLGKGKLLWRQLVLDFEKSFHVWVHGFGRSRSRFMLSLRLLLWLLQSLPLLEFVLGDELLLSGLFSVVLWMLLLEVTAFLLLLELLLLLVVQSDIVQDAQVLQEVILVSILSEDLEDADHLVVAAGNQTVEEGDSAIFDHAQHGILAKDLVLVLHDAIDVFHIVRVLLLI